MHRVDLFVPRSVGLYTILFFLAWTVVLSVCETALALLLGAIARTRMLQVGAAVAALAGLFFGVGTWLSFLLSFGLSNLTTPVSGELVAFFAIFTILAVAVSLVLRMPLQRSIFQVKITRPRYADAFSAYCRSSFFGRPWALSMLRKWRWPMCC